MQASGPVEGSALRLVGRREEIAVLGALLSALKVGQSRALVICGEPGIGKTALLEYLATAPFRVARVAGVQSEMELAFAGVHQLCVPMLDHLEHLPLPQRTAICTAFGMAEGSAPDRFLVGLAVLNLLSDAAADKPLLCLIDDEQWLDRASAHVLAFVARRLGAESVGLVFAAREPSDAIAGLPALVVRGLRNADARALLDSILVARLDPRVRDQIVAETRGSPLALLEVQRGLTSEELAGGFGVLTDARFSAAEEIFRSRIAALPDKTRQLLLIAAAEPTGDLALMWRAATQLGIRHEAAEPAIEADLSSFTTRVRFRHPLIRSAAYRSASIQERRQVHSLLAAATDRHVDPDRRAWHMANAVSGPDEDVAAELERSAERAQGRGGIGAAAAFLERAATLTINRAHRGDRALAAASAKVQAGAFDVALDLLSMAETEQLNDFQQAQANLVRAKIAFVTSRGSDAPPLLLKAAKQLESIDIAMSRATYRDAMTAAMFAGRLAVGGNVVDVAHAAQAGPRVSQPERPPELLLDWLITHHTRGYVAAVPALHTALAAFDDAHLTAGEQLGCVFLASTASYYAWDDIRLEVLSNRHVQLARETGALSDVPLALSSRAIALLFFGDLAGAAALVDELAVAQEATQSDLAPYAALGLAALRGDHEEALRLIERTVAEVRARGEGNGITVAWWAEAVLHNGTGSYAKALDAAVRAASFPTELGASNWALPELVEAAARNGATATAAEAVAQLEALTAASGSDWARGIGARSKALVGEDDTAEALYREAIDRLEKTRARGELARAHLVYGEWLRRQRRRSEARRTLQFAYDSLSSIGMRGFADRARRELKATGISAQERGRDTDGRQLTAQEMQVARLARDGLSNPEIGARLFISGRTVQYHLSKVFTKLEITSRNQLDRALPSTMPG